MKTVKFLNSLFTAILFILILGSAASVVLNVNPFYAYASLAGATAVGTWLKAKYPEYFIGIALAAIYREVWTGEVIKKMALTDQFSWVAAIKKDYSQYVQPVGEEAEVIHLSTFLIEPDVLIDNNLYPIPIQDLPFDDVPISLNKFQTKVIPITDDEVYASSVSKMQNVSAALALSVLKNKYSYGAWRICPTGNSAATPVLLTTGPDDGTGRKRLIWEDLLRYKTALDAEGTEVSDDPGSRILVFSKDHENDLAAVDQKFKDQFYNFQTGKPYESLGFTFYGYNRNPYYNTIARTKLAFGGVPTNAYRRASMFFSTDRVGKAIGSTKAYLSPSSTAPEMQRALISTRHYHLITRLMNEGVGAIVSPDA